MPDAYLYLLAALGCFAAMGVLHKLGDRLGCEPVHVALVTMTFGGVAALTRAGGAGVAAAPAEVYALAVPFGVCAAAALWAFQAGVRHGRIATSWLLLNLSVAVPTGLSMALYGERLTPLKTAAVVLIAAAVVLMWYDRRGEDAAHGPAAGNEG